MNVENIVHIADDADDLGILKDAEQLESVLPRIARRLFAMEPDDVSYELPAAQLKVCNFLLNGQSTVSELAEEMRISASAATQLADRMEKNGLINRSGETNDRRVRLLTLTDRSRDIMEARRNIRRARAVAALSGFSATQRQAVLTSLFSLLDATSRAAEAPHEAPDEMYSHETGSIKTRCDIVDSK